MTETQIAKNNYFESCGASRINLIVFLCQKLDLNYAIGSTLVDQLIKRSHLSFGPI